MSRGPDTNCPVEMKALFLSLFAFAAAGVIPNVPYHRQITDYACGDASSEMVLHYWLSPDVDQRAIIDVLRTTTEDGPCARLYRFASFVMHHFVSRHIEL